MANWECRGFITRQPPPIRTWSTPTITKKKQKNKNIKKTQTKQKNKKKQNNQNNQKTNEKTKKIMILMDPNVNWSQGTIMAPYGGGVEDGPMNRPPGDLPLGNLCFVVCFLCSFGPEFMFFILCGRKKLD